MKSVAIVDYGMGNLRSVTQAVMHAAENTGVEVIWAKTPQEVMAADRVVLPGQGAIRDCMVELENSGMKAAVLHALKNKPLLGICVGMQMLLEHSEEQDTTGLGVFAGEVKRFDLVGQHQPDGNHLKVPQIGWNNVSLPLQYKNNPHPVWGNIPEGSYFYFVHSYYANPAQPEVVAGETEYGLKFCSIVAKNNVFATQFHPEKSAEHGLMLFKNFIGWQP